jgi:hypothetical protein
VHLPKPGPATAEPGIWRHGALGGVVAECKGDNPEHHQDGSGYYHQMRKFHWAPHFFFSTQAPQIAIARRAREGVDIDVPRLNLHVAGCLSVALMRAGIGVSFKASAFRRTGNRQ